MCETISQIAPPMCWSKTLGVAPKSLPIMKSCFGYPKLHILTSKHHLVVICDGICNVHNQQLPGISTSTQKFLPQLKVWREDEL